MEKVLMKGNEVVGAAAIRGGCRYFFGYPITPQNEVPEYMSRELPKVGGVFLQAESEIAAINMVYGAAGSGARVMTSSSGPGIALQQEGISYIAGAELPCVIVNMMRGGPGLGSIQPGQADYFQSTRGGGNGDYRHIVYAPASVQETADILMEAFDIADYYRIPVLVLGDGMIGQMMEPVEFRDPPERDLPAKEWAATGTEGRRAPNIINSLYLKPDELEEHNRRLAEKHARIEENETRWESFHLDDAEIVFVSYGTSARIVHNAVDILREEGVMAGLIRPITLWPFPWAAFEEIGGNARALMSVEMSMGQMVDDVKIASAGRWPVGFYGRSGGMVPDQHGVVEAAKSFLQEVK
ncbi:MAG: 3-methyl-2-oxobutanoate dehydrogenase subunit VorB [Alkalispirochaeta sp.]